MKKTLLAMVMFMTVFGLQLVNAQDHIHGNYRTMPKEQLEAIASQSQSDYKAMKDRVSSAKSQIKAAKKNLKEAERNYKELSKQLKASKAQMKSAQKALKLRKKLNKLSR